MPGYTTLPDDFQFQFQPMNAAEVSVMSLALAGVYALFQSGPIAAMMELQAGLNIIFENGGNPDTLGDAMRKLMKNIDLLEDHLRANQPQETDHDQT